MFILFADLLQSPCFWVVLFCAALATAVHPSVACAGDVFSLLFFSAASSMFNHRSSTWLFVSFGLFTLPCSISSGLSVSRQPFPLLLLLLFADFFSDIFGFFLAPAHWLGCYGAELWECDLRSGRTSRIYTETIRVTQTGSEGREKRAAGGYG